MGEFHFGAETVLALVIAIMGWFFKRSVKAVDDEIKECREAVDEHVKDCNEVPKSTIIEKIDNLSKTLSIAHHENTKRLDKIETQIFEIATGKFRVVGGGSDR